MCLRLLNRVSKEGFTETEQEVKEVRELNPAEYSSGRELVQRPWGRIEACPAAEQSKIKSKLYYGL